MWFLGSTVAYFLGVSSALGPILGFAAGAIVAFDPRGIFWGSRSDAPATANNALPSES
jgi:hypothetical protein